MHGLAEHDELHGLVGRIHARPEVHLILNPAARRLLLNLVECQQDREGLAVHVDVVEYDEGEQVLVAECPRHGVLALGGSEEEAAERRIRDRVAGGLHLHEAQLVEVLLDVRSADRLDWRRCHDRIEGSDAELALVKAENDAAASRAHLAATLGEKEVQQMELADEPLPAPLDASPEGLVSQALKDRPDLASLKLNRDAAHRLADAERALSHPTVMLMGAAGVLPATDPKLHGTYSAAGVNVSIPVWNGKLFSARQAQAEFRAGALDRQVDDLTVQVSEQVRLAWLAANTAFRRLDVTARLVEQAEQSLRLAQLRYDNGLGSIVELNQAQVSQVSAQITAAAAKYEYLSRRAGLAFVTGALR